MKRVKVASSTKVLKLNSLAIVKKQRVLSRGQNSAKRPLVSRFVKDLAKQPSEVLNVAAASKAKKQLQFTSKSDVVGQGMKMFLSAANGRST